MVLTFLPECIPILAYGQHPFLGKKHYSSVGGKESNRRSDWVFASQYLPVQNHKPVSAIKVWDDLVPALCCDNEETEAQESQVTFSKVTQWHRGSLRPELLFLGSSLLWLTEITDNEELSGVHPWVDIQQMCHSSLLEICQTVAWQLYRLEGIPPNRSFYRWKKPWDPQKTNLSATTQPDGSSISHPGTRSFPAPSLLFSSQHHTASLPRLKVSSFIITQDGLMEPIYRTSSRIV